ncbi:unnamed protein product [Miscanthus lutarioriparius]|uniref:Inhibitor I9 domain-containing protein n=1 Tax=Miscanthus lutarioriparius TaxID=422564 RepID=A0A811N6C9_9POAL|nr:unnamed protein product [Miscanthus lutarioriparius]
MKRSAASTVPLVRLLLLLAVATASAAATGGMAGAAEAEHAANYLVYVNPHPPGVDCQAYQLGILAAALGSEAKAKAAILYNYRNVMSGFSARLTPPELEAVKKQPQVNRVLPSATLSLMSSKFDGVS